MVLYERATRPGTVTSFQALSQYDQISPVEKVRRAAHKRVPKDFFPVDVKAEKGK